MIYYKIFPACKQDLYLTLTSDLENSAVLQSDLKEEKDRQLWTPVETFNSRGNKEFVLLNKFAYKVLAARGERESLTQVSPSETPNHLVTWTYLPIEKWPYFGAIQLRDNQNMNLNAFGNEWGPGTTVGIHDWKKGATNEVWQFIVVEAKD